MHRLTQAILRDRLTLARASAMRRCTEAILAASDPGDPPDPGTWTRWAQLMPHVLAADLAATDNPALRELVRRAAWYLVERGDARTARDLMSNLRQQWRDRLGADHPHTLMAGHYLAWALWELGRYAESRDLNRDTLERHRNVLGEDHPDTLNSAHNLAMDLRMLGEARRPGSGPGHPGTLSPLAGLGSPQHIAFRECPGRRPACAWRSAVRPRSGPGHPGTPPPSSRPRSPERPELRPQPSHGSAHAWRIAGRPRPGPAHAGAPPPSSRPRPPGNPQIREQPGPALRALGEAQAARDLDQDTLDAAATSSARSPRHPHIRAQSRSRPA